jgi:predicted RNase H-like HicB family nuclease
MQYPIAIEPGDETHAFGVVVPDLPGCFSAGDTLEEALVNSKEAIALWIECELDEGHDIPDASPLSAITQNPDFKNWVFAVVDIGPETLSEKTERINVCLPQRALRRLDVLAKKAGESRSGYLARAIYSMSAC